MTPTASVALDMALFSEAPQCTTSQCSTDRNQAAEIYRRLDQHIERCEDALGFENLLRSIGSMDLRRVNAHVDLYRPIIRMGDWPNEARPAALTDFLTDFEASCVAYIEVAFVALDHLIRGEPNVERIYGLVTASEALRGQFGKQSPTGLDARLAALEDDLAVTLPAIFGEAWERVMWPLCTPHGAALSAEAALQEDFIELRRRYPKPPSVFKISSADPESRHILRAFLRRHCRWSLARLSQCYAQFDDEFLCSRVNAARDRRRELAGRREETVRELNERCPTATAARILASAEAITVLNGVNLSVEPAFSFKGCAGLVHGVIFERESLLPTERVAREFIVRQKWALLAQAHNLMKEANYG